jgi:pilus assembly protein Flp/PilA
VLYLAKDGAKAAKIGQRRGQRLYTEATEYEWRIEMIIKAITTLQSFRKEEDGLALTEYLLLLGLLTGAVIVSVITFGEGIAEGWRLWAAWIGTGSGLGGPAESL